MQAKWDMELFGATFSSHQKMCALPLICSMRNEENCGWMGSFLKGIGISLNLSNCETICTPGTPVDGNMVSTTIQGPLTYEIESGINNGLYLKDYY